ncbi:MAG: 12-oxophytodienoate reductase, partial [Caulobacteraceae bacterium]|nr:12-oxophytodienoate reductase [Caulobacteraceae bacterium]
VTTMAVGGVGLSKDLQTSFVEPTKPVDNLAPIVSRFQAGEFDLLAVGRSLLVDPEWARKARAGAPFHPFSRESYAKLV